MMRAITIMSRPMSGILMESGVVHMHIYIYVFSEGSSHQCELRIAQSGRKLITFSYLELDIA